MLLFSDTDWDALHTHSLDPIPLHLESDFQGRVSTVTADHLRRELFVEWCVEGDVTWTRESRTVEGGVPGLFPIQSRSQGHVFART